MEDRGPRCRVHERLPAIARCPACRAEACPLCWHVAPARCTACLAKEPGGDAPEVPWEMRGNPAVRFLRTLAGAFQPQATAASFGRPRGVGRAATFAALTLLPALAAFGAIALTRTLLFDGGLSLAVAAHAGARAIAVDVARSVLLAFALGAGALVVVALPYVSLCRAYGRSPDATHAAVRVLLYRVWVPPAAWVLYLLLGWALPSVPEEVVKQAGSLALVVGLVGLSLAMRNGARDAAVVGPWMSWVVTLVPLALLMTALQLAGPSVARLFPDTPPPQRGASANGSPT